MTSPEFLPPRPELPDAMGSVPPPLPPEPPPEPPSIALWVPFAVMGIVFIAIGTFSAAVLGIAHAMDPTIKIGDPPDSLTIALTFVQDAALVLAAVLTFKIVFGRVRPADLGLRRVTRWGYALKMMAALYLAFWIVAFALEQIFGTPPDQQLVTDLKAEQSFAILAGFAVLTCVVAPICEEIFFRGFMFRVFADRMGLIAGAALSGAIFGLVHLTGGPLTTGLVLFALGFGFALLRWWTGSLLPSMGLHALNNSVSFGVTLGLEWWIVVPVVAGSVALVLASGLRLAESNWGRLNA
jgi:uncharacterized protein